MIFFSFPKKLSVGSSAFQKILQWLDQPTLVFFWIFEKNYSDWIKCKLYKSRNNFELPSYTVSTLERELNFCNGYLSLLYICPSRQYHMDYFFMKVDSFFLPKTLKSKCIKKESCEFKIDVIPLWKYRRSCLKSKIFKPDNSSDQNTNNNVWFLCT